MPARDKWSTNYAQVPAGERLPRQHRGVPSMQAASKGNTETLRL